MILLSANWVIFLSSIPARGTTSSQIVQAKSSSLIPTFGVRGDLVRATKIYYISISNWTKFNKKSKPSLPHIMLSKRFFDDAKIQKLSNGGKLLFLGLLLRRGDVESSFVEASHEDLVRFAGGSGQVVATLLDQLQSLQLLTWSKTPPNIIEKKIIEEKEDPKNSEKSENLKAESFNTILNATKLQNAALTRAKEIANFEEKLFHPLAFGSSPPVGFSKIKSKFLATLVEIYEGSESDFLAHLNSIIAEEGVKEREGVARTDYLFTRIKNKALELHNAKQS